MRLTRSLSTPTSQYELLCYLRHIVSDALDYHNTEVMNPIDFEI